MADSRSQPRSASSPIIELQVAGPWQEAVAESRLREAITAALALHGQAPASLTLVVATDDVLRRLNRQFAGADAATDVLSFSAREARPDQKVSFVSAPDAAGYLGDVIISYETAARQAAAAGHAVMDELCLLAIHGVLHLLGYDHATKAEQATMWAVQEQILSMLGIKLSMPEGEDEEH